MEQLLHSAWNVTSINCRLPLKLAPGGKTDACPPTTKPLVLSIVGDRGISKHCGWEGMQLSGCMYCTLTAASIAGLYERLTCQESKSPTLAMSTKTSKNDPMGTTGLAPTGLGSTVTSVPWAWTRLKGAIDVASTSAKTRAITVLVVFIFSTPTSGFFGGLASTRVWPGSERVCQCWVARVDAELEVRCGYQEVVQVVLAIIVRIVSNLVCS